MLPLPAFFTTLCLFPISDLEVRSQMNLCAWNTFACLPFLAFHWPSRWGEWYMFPFWVSVAVITLQGSSRQSLLGSSSSSWVLGLPRTSLPVPRGMWVLRSQIWVTCPSCSREWTVNCDFVGGVGASHFSNGGCNQVVKATEAHPLPPGQTRGLRIWFLQILKGWKSLNLLNV